MSSDFTIVVDTLGTGVWYSHDGGETFNIANGIMSSAVKPGSKVADGIFNELKIQVLTPHRTEHQIIYAGAHHASPTLHLYEAPFSWSTPALVGLSCSHAKIMSPAYRRRWE